MDITIRQVEGVTLLDLSGRITMGEASSMLRAAVQQALAANSKKIVVNLSQVSYIDSAGLGDLVGAYTSAKNAGAELKLLNLTRRVKDLLVITKLSTIFAVSDNERDAVHSFA